MVTSIWCSIYSSSFVRKKNQHSLNLSWQQFHWLSEWWWWCSLFFIIFFFWLIKIEKAARKKVLRWRWRGSFPVSEGSNVFSFLSSNNFLSNTTVEFFCFLARIFVTCHYYILWGLCFTELFSFLYSFLFIYFFSCCRTRSRAWRKMHFILKWINRM